MKNFYLFKIHEQRVLFGDEKIDQKYFYSQLNLFCFTNHKSFQIYVLAHKDQHSFIFIFNKADELLKLLEEKNVNCIEHSIESYYIKYEAKYRHKLIAKLNGNLIFHYNFSNGYEYWTKAEIIDTKSNTKQVIADVSRTQFPYYKDLDYLTKLSHLKFDLLWHEQSSLHAPGKKLKAYLNQAEKQKKKNKRNNWLVSVIIIIILFLFFLYNTA